MDEPDRRSDDTIRATGEGRATAVPDRAEVVFAVEGEDESVAVARWRATDAATALFDVLAEAGVPDEAVGTRGFRVRPRRRDDPADADPPDERVATQTVGYRTTDLDALDRVVTAAVDDAGADVRDVSFGFREATRRDLREAALADATATARREASAAAGVEGLAVGGVRTMEVQGSRGTGTGGQLESGRGGPVVDLTPEQRAVEARVEATFALVDDGAAATDASDATPDAAE
jgi:uncharacterized protein YggE